MNLKLAEYNLETGKFERFLELSKYHSSFLSSSYNPTGFMLGKDYVRLRFSGNDIYRFETNNIDLPESEFLIDKTDPLNRFDGLFDGRTYGEGRFVLIESKIISRFDNPLLMSQDDIFSYNEYTQKACDFINFHYWEETEEQVEMNPNFKILGNLHENPELWEKVK